MALEPIAHDDLPPVRVRFVGREDVADAVRSALDGHADVSLHAVEPTASFLSRSSSPDDCVLTALPDEAEATVDRVCAHVSAPTVLLGEYDPQTAVDAGAVDAVPVDADLPARVRWLAATGARTPDVGALDALGEAACAVTPGWRVADTTANAADLLGGPGSVDEGTLWEARPDLLGTDLRDACWRAILDGERTTASVELSPRRLAADVAPVPAGLLLRFQDVTDRTADRRTLDRYERILETIDDGIYTLDENFTITHVNDAVTALTGYSRDELLGSHATLLADESVIVEASDLVQEILLGERDSGRLEVSLETKSGDVLQAETHFSALQFGDGSYGSVGVIRDITDRKRYERALTALNRSTRELFRSSSKPDVAKVAVDTAADVLELGAAAVYLFYEEEGVLLPTAWTGETSPPPIEPGDGATWRSFVEASPTTVDGDGDAPRRSTPLGEHGLLITAPADEPPPADRLGTPTRLLAANVEAALDRVDRSSELASRERTLAQRNEELTHLNRFNELIRDVDRALVEADSREAIERAVCDRLADSPLLAFAWIGEHDAATGALAPRAWAGAERGYLDGLPDQDSSRSERVGGVEPSLRTAQTGDAAVVDNVSEDLQRHEWRQRALSCEFRSVASVPVVYNDYRYGVLSVYAADPGAFDEETQTMFEELGVTTANAINSAQAKETLLTEAVVELDIRVPAPNAPLRRVARATGAKLRVEGTVPQPDGDPLLYLSVPESEGVSEAVESVAPVTSVTEVGAGDGELLLEVRVDGPTVATKLADYGAAINDLVADAETVETVVELPRGVDVRELVETLASTYPGTELVARRTRERPVETGRAFRTTIEDDLTERQLDALRTAYLSGYFEWPRERSGQEVASSLDIAQPTFARHLRIAQRKILSRFFDGSH